MKDKNCDKEIKIFCIFLVFALKSVTAAFPIWLSCDSCSLSMQFAHLVEMEVKHRCNQILELGFPLGGLAKLFAQDWEGDVTVVMPATLAQVCTKKVHDFDRILV